MAGALGDIQIWCSQHRGSSEPWQWLRSPREDVSGTDLQGMNLQGLAEDEKLEKSRKEAGGKASWQ